MASTSRINTLDWLRGLAILGVICVHVSQSFPTHNMFLDKGLELGRFGVQLFYFVSALTMCYMWELRNGEECQAAKFYIRRFLRIAPLFWVAIPVYLYLNGSGASHWAPNGIGLHQIVLTAAFLHGFWPDSINSVVPGGWSIAVEMTFYLIFPLLITKIKKQVHFLYLAITAYFFDALFINPLATDLLGGGDLIKDFLYLNFFNQAPVFFVGCYLYGLSKSNVKIDYKKMGVVFILWIATAMAVNDYLKPAAQNINFLLVVVGEFAFVLFAIRKQLKFAALERLGKNSYAIYLCHFAVIGVVSEIYGIASLNKEGVSAFVFGVAAVTAIAYIFSVGSYNLVEKKIHRVAERLTK